MSKTIIVKRVFQRALLSSAAAALSLTMATGAMATATLYSPSTISGGIGLGFGKFIGTWEVDNNVSDLNDMPVPEGLAGTNAALVGAAINGQYNPDLFNINEFRYAGGTGSYVTTGPGNGFRVESKLDAYTAKWTYEGFPGTPSATNPGMQPVDLFIAVKYSNYVSVFRYDLVDPDTDNDGSSSDDNVFGYFSSDFRTIILNTALANGVSFANANSDAELLALAANYTALNYDGFYTGFSGGCTLAGVNKFSGECMMYNPNGSRDPYGVSHVVAYWPPVEGEAVPEPASMTLFGAGLLGLGYLHRRRKAA